MGVFNEQRLRNEIIETWGEHGVHAEVYNRLVRGLYLVKQASFCPFCGEAKQLIISTDINSGRVCKNKLCNKPFEL